MALTQRHKLPAAATNYKPLACSEKEAYQRLAHFLRLADTFASSRRTRRGLRAGGHAASIRAGFTEQPNLLQSGVIAGLHEAPGANSAGDQGSNQADPKIPALHTATLTVTHANRPPRGTRGTRTTVIPYRKPHRGAAPRAFVSVAERRSSVAGALAAAVTHRTGRVIRDGAAPVYCNGWFGWAPSVLNPGFATVHRAGLRRPGGRPALVGGAAVPLVPRRGPDWYD